MKKQILSFILILAATVANAQQAVGIDVSVPLQKLDVAGAIRIGNTSANEAGSIRYNGTNFQGYDGVTWKNLDATGGSGTVTSVDMSLPNIFSVTGSPVTTAGTLTAALASQNGNLVFASPNGSNGTPTFRALVPADIPDLNASKITAGTLPIARGGTGSGSKNFVDLTNAQTVAGIKTWSSNGIFNGRVGIGTNSPAVPLEVNGSTNSHSFGTTYIRANSSSTLWQTSGLSSTSSVSIKASASIWTAGGQFISSSDKRTKANIENMNTENALMLINSLNVVSYNWIDPAKSSQKQQGFIAQELENVLPEAITTVAEVIPDIMELVETYQYNDNTLKFTLKKNIELKEGDFIRIIVEDEGEYKWKVSAINGNEIVVTTNENFTGNNRIFVFGREVDDFKTVDYDRVFVHNISATQELYKRIEQYKKQIAELEKTVATLLTGYEAMKTALEDVETMKNILFQEARK